MQDDSALDSAFGRSPPANTLAAKLPQEMSK